MQEYARKYHFKNLQFYVDDGYSGTNFDRPSFRKLEQQIENGEQGECDLKEFLKNVRKYTDPKELTAELLNDLVDKIIVHAPDKSSGHRKQKIEIYYKAVGIINIANEECVALDGRFGMKNRKKKTA